MRRHGLNGIIFPLSVLFVMVCVSHVVGAQNAADSCLGCHTSADQLKKITLERDR